MQTITGDQSRAYDAVCVKECPTGIPDLTTQDYLLQDRLDCMVNNDATQCMKPNYNSTVVMRFCVPEFTSTAETLNKISM